MKISSRTVELRTFKIVDGRKLEKNPCDSTLYLLQKDGKDWCYVGSCEAARDWCKRRYSDDD